MKTTAIRANLLGDLKAEADTDMLDHAFLETPDFRTLIETSDRIVVVGRRGTGKSALAFALAKYWKETETAVVRLTPEEYQVISVRPLIQLFGDKFLRIRAGARLIWRYAFMMETLLALEPRASTRASSQFSFLGPHLDKWKSRGSSIPDRVRSLIREQVRVEASPEDRIGDLPVKLDLKRTEDALAEVCKQVDRLVVFLIDKLDEGYEPDVVGVGLIDGLVQAAIDLKTRIPNVRVVIFLRDNIFRAVQTLDQDYSRNIEGHVLRLHWSENDLFNFTAARLRIAFNFKDESSIKIWNACTTEQLQGRDSFSRCLRLTLYRPRDILALLNEAFFFAAKDGNPRISPSHVDATAKTISQNRLDDLIKEYSGIIPGLRTYVALFEGRPAERNVGDIIRASDALLTSGSSDSRIQQDFFILEDATSVIRGLYSVGFLGVRDPTTGRFVFCHDGRAPDREFAVGDAVLVHPCYWMAINSTTNSVDPEMADDVYDEYDIEVASDTPHIRIQKIDELMRQLDLVPEGPEGASQFETWCHKAIRIAFARSLRNVELKPNKLANQRRDVVGTNLGDAGAWKRIREDYETRQVIFEIKNYKDITAADYQQIRSYLSGEYGRLAFVVTRDGSVDLYANREIEWLREMYMNHRVLIVKLTGVYLRRLLHKLRNPQKHDAVDGAIHTLLDTYTRLYLAGQTAGQPEVRRGMSRKKRRKLELAAVQP
ncbi:MAG: ATP-binding protein [Steroidobacteraceae bacterium]